MRKIGLVLAGGGGRGAYQIGVWKALHDVGLDGYITAVSGASVGGLNAALFIQNDLDKALSIWKSISMEKILAPKYDSNHSGQVRHSIFERDGLEKIIDNDLDMRCFDNSKYNCWISCVRTDNPGKNIEELRHMTPIGDKVTYKYAYEQIEYFNLKYINDDNERKRIILATSAMPFIFPKEEIEGHKYLDGGARLFHGDNVPVRPLYEIDKCNIILIIHLTNMDEPVKRKEFPHATVFEIFPKENLGKLLDGGGILDFTAEGAARRIDQGYGENYELFRQIKGNIDCHKELLDGLADAYTKELQYENIKETLQEKAIELMKECERI